MSNNEDDSNNLALKALELDKKLVYLEEAYGDTPEEKKLTAQVEILMVKMERQALTNKQQALTNKQLTLTNKQFTLTNKQQALTNKQLTSGIHGIRTALRPAVEYSLLETAVYESITFHTAVDPDIPDDKTKEKFKYRASRFGGFILTSLVVEKAPEKGDIKSDVDHLKKYDKTWRKEKGKSVREVLAGLMLFVQHTSKEELKNWPPERHVLVHNGALSAAVCPRDPTSDISLEEGATWQQGVWDKTDLFARLGGENSRVPNNIKDGVADLYNALRTKRCVPFENGLIEGVAKVISDILDPPPANLQPNPRGDGGRRRGHKAGGRGRQGGRQGGHCTT